MDDQLKYIPFVVNESPFACWGYELQKKNVEFLNNIDIDHLIYIAETHSNNLNNENMHQAALAIRVAYYQFMEILFALLGSLIQAPTCIAGWMLSYKNIELRKLVTHVSNNKEIFSRWNIEKITWHRIAELVMSYTSISKEKKWVIKRFGDFWEKISSDFTNEIIINEYNSAKHGLRTKSGGGYLFLGEEEKVGVPAKPDKMVDMGGSEYGTTFFCKDYIFDETKNNFGIYNQRMNWNPEYLVDSIFFIIMSIKNVISTLLIVNNEKPEKCTFSLPDKGVSSKIFSFDKVGITNVGMKEMIETKFFKPLSKKQIIESYGKKSKK